MACLSLLRIRHALATCAAGLMLALPAMASSSNTTDLGLDREAATAAFADLIAAGTASAGQLQFIDEIVQHLTEHGAMPAARLYESPFTDIHVQGPDGVFEPGKVEQLFAALDQLQLAPVAASAA